MRTNIQSAIIAGSNTVHSTVGSGRLINLIVTVSGAISIWDGKADTEDPLIPVCTYPIGVHRVDIPFTNALFVKTDAIARATITFEQDIIE